MDTEPSETSSSSLVCVSSVTHTSEKTKRGHRNYDLFFKHAAVSVQARHLFKEMSATLFLGFFRPQRPIRAEQ